jgi:hypothetical protein
MRNAKQVIDSAPDMTDARNVWKTVAYCFDDQRLEIHGDDDLYFPRPNVH